MIYCDYAATNGTVPEAVRAAVADYLMHPGNPGRGTHARAMDAARRVLDARFALADFFGCSDPARVVFTGGATQSLNTAIRGLIRPGDHVVTTFYEHNSVLRPLYQLEKAGVDLTITDGTPQAIAEAMRPNTHAVVMTHASNVTGDVLDIRAVGRIAHARGALLVVDAAQTAGVLPISMVDDGIDVLCFAGHKSMMGMQGVGGMVIGEGVEIAPLTVGGSGIHSFGHEHPRDLPEGLEAGTQNVPGIASLLAAQGVIAQRGLANIAAHERALAERLENAICGAPGVRIYHGDGPRVGIVSLTIDGMDSAAVADRLANIYGIAARAGAHCAPLVHEHFGTASMVRLSFGWDNTTADADACARAILEIARA